MIYNKINQTDIKTSLLSLGTMTFGAQNSYEQSAEMIDMAIDNGINFIDTAELYPSPADEEHNAYHTEQFIGKWLNTSNVNRNDLVIVSKVMGPHNHEDELSKVARPNKDPLSPTTITSSVDGILKRLNTDYIDVLLIHWPLRNANCFGVLGYDHKKENFDVEKQILDTITTMDKLIKDGKIRHYGVSNETAWGLMKYIQLAENNNLPKPVVCQNPYSLLNRSYEVGCAEVSMREDIGLMSYSVLGGGVLSGKHINSIAKDSRLDLRPDYYGRYVKPQAIKATKAYTELANKHGIDPAIMAIAFVNEKDFNLTTITGSTKPQHLQTYIDSVNVKLSSELLAEIEEIHKQYTYPAP
ncbi:MAG: aldo/keto reductase [Alphaproteobacteria bacterium]